MLAMTKNNIILQHKFSLLLATIVSSIIMLLLHGYTGSDDSHITYSAAKQLTLHGAILNHNGLYVEQGSSVLHVLLLAASHIITGLDFPQLGPWFSLFCAILCLPLSLELAKLSNVRQPALVVFLLPLSLAFNYWSAAGLETPLVTISLTLYAIFLLWSVNHFLLLLFLYP